MTKKNQSKIKSDIYNAALRRFGSHQRMRIFEDAEVQCLFEKLDNPNKVDFLKSLCDSSDHPSRQLARVGYDALSEIDYYFFDDLRDGDELYRIYLSDVELDGDDYYDPEIFDNGIGGSWFTAKEDAQTFLDEMSDSFCSFRWGDRMPKYAYRLTIDSTDAKVIWENTTSRGAEVVINGIDEMAYVFVELVGTRAERANAA
jgi:hypothetical protein